MTTGDLTPERAEDQKRSEKPAPDADQQGSRAVAEFEIAARADMRIEVVKRELSQGALAGFDSSVTDYAAKLVIAALDSFDEDALKAEFRRGFEAGEVNAALLHESSEGDTLRHSNELPEWERDLLERQWREDWGRRG